MSILETFGSVIRPLFNIGLGQIPGVQPIYKCVWKHLGPKGIKITRVNNFQMYIACHDWAVAPTLLFAHVWEPAETELCKQHIKEGMTVIDAGAYIGYYTLLASKLVGDKGRVYSFEPSPESLVLLHKNIKLNNCKNVQVFEGAVTDKKGYMTFHVSTTNLSGSSMFPKYSDPIGFRGTSITVPTTSLDEVVGDRKVDFIKMDVEGGETKAINGMTGIIKNNPSLKMIIEVCPSGLKELGSSLEEHIGFLRNHFRIHTVGKNGLASEASLEDIKREFKKYAVINLFCCGKG